MVRGHFPEPEMVYKFRLRFLIEESSTWRVRTHVSGDMTSRDFDQMFEARTEKKMFSVQERELPWLAQEQAEARGFRENCGVADPLRSL